MYYTKTCPVCAYRVILAYLHVRPSVRILCLCDNIELSCERAKQIPRRIEIYTLAQNLLTRSLKRASVVRNNNDIAWFGYFVFTSQKITTEFWRPSNGGGAVAVVAVAVSVA